MPFVPYGHAPMFGVPGTLMTANNPAPTPVPASNRGWVKAVNPYATGRAMAPFIGSEIVFRGDTRTPTQITAAGGLWAHQPNAVGAGHDPDVHQAGPGATIYVSCTRDLGVAKGFAFGGYVYVLRVNAGVDYNAFRNGNAAQAEVMAIRGAALADIIGARNVANNALFVNTGFQQAGMAPAQWHAAMQALQN